MTILRLLINWMSGLRRVEAIPPTGKQLAAPTGLKENSGRVSWNPAAYATGYSYELQDASGKVVESGEVHVPLGEYLIPPQLQFPPGDGPTTPYKFSVRAVGAGTSFADSGYSAGIDLCLPTIPQLSAPTGIKVQGTTFHGAPLAMRMPMS